MVDRSVAPAGTAIPLGRTQATLSHFHRLFGALLVTGVLGQVFVLLGLVSSLFDPDLLLSHPFLALSILGSFVIYLTQRPTPRELATTGAVAIAIAAILLLSPLERAAGRAPLYWALADGLGIGAILVTAIVSGRAEGAAKNEARLRLYPLLLLPLFACISLPYLDLTTILWPVTLDSRIYALDATYGTQLSFDLGLLFQHVPILTTICQSVYLALPLALGLIYGLQQQRSGPAGTDVLTAFFAVAAVGFVLYFLFPVAGPVFAYGNFYPESPISGAQALSLPPVAPAVPRNCVPSLHTAWALLVFWHSRGMHRVVRVSAGLFLFFTLMATLGLGFHYLYDLVVAVPFTLAVHTACMPGAPTLARRKAVLAGVGLTVFWLAMIPVGHWLFSPSPVVPWVLSLWTITLVVVLEGRLHATRAVAVAQRRSGPTVREVSRTAAGIAAIFFLSGTAALVYQVVFAKSLAVTFGSTARATVIVLASYMGGLALGSWLGGRVANRITRLVRAYAIAEIGIAVWCGAAPWLLSGAQAAYVTLARGSDPSAGHLVWLQLGLGAALLIPPTLLMGLTLPILTRHFTGRDESLGRAVGLLYGVNTLGAAFGALATGYLLLPTLGIIRSLLVAVAINVVVALLGLRLGRTARESTEGKQEETRPSGASRAFVEPSRGDRRLGVIAVVTLTVSGVVTFGLETAYTHLLAVVAGNSAYAFSLMLFTFLLGLGGGAALGRRLLRGGLDLPLGLGGMLLGIALTILLGVFLWDRLPSYFASFASYPAARSFPAREFVRFTVCTVAMLPPALFVGALYPVAMECVGRAWPGHSIAAMGRTAAGNTLGNILGALLTGFVLLPNLGSLRTLHVLAGTLIVLAGLTLLAPGRVRRLAISGGLAVALTVLALQPSQFDLTRLASGANVYFMEQSYGTVIDHAESMDGGLTTVARSEDPDGEEVLTLLTNGKFQGDDSRDREMGAQTAFALAPLLHTDERDQALVIGLGTGVTTKVLTQAGFAHIDVAELSGDIARLADVYFESVNEGVLRRPNVDVHITDGRNYLLLTEAEYDVVSMEISSIWFAGAASLYNREFYELVEERLSDDGVLQQWLQLHRISPHDVLTVLGTVRSVFEQVWLYFLGQQGIIIACDDDCAPDRAALARLSAEEGLKGSLALFGGEPTQVLRGRLLSPQGVDALLTEAAEHGLDHHDLISTDDNLQLEYSTPRGNVNPYLPSLRRNVAFLRRFEPESLLTGTALKASDLPFDPRRTGDRPAASQAGEEVAD